MNEENGNFFNVEKMQEFRTNLNAIKTTINKDIFHNFYLTIQSCQNNSNVQDMIDTYYQINKMRLAIVTAIDKRIDNFIEVIEKNTDRRKVVQEQVTVEISDLVTSTLTDVEALLKGE